ncbi:MAG TPA: hypothetical protein PKD12_14470 [Nitrospira sp.]|nr:hypothetical protein [Nitrospira sp.]
MKQSIFWLLSAICIAGLLPACSGSDNSPTLLTPSGPTASVEEQRGLQSDVLTPEETTLMSQAESEPDPVPLLDL